MKRHKISKIKYYILHFTIYFLIVFIKIYIGNFILLINIITPLLKEILK